MSNFDSAMGESHHKSKAKKPALQTQRRKNDFEEQTAKRQIENNSIRFAHESISVQKPKKLCKDFENKSFCYEYVHEHRKIFFRERGRKLHECEWIDTKFQKQLTDECWLAVATKKLRSPIRFFTQHNRHGIIFHANPDYKDQDPWYDWAYVNWGESVVPAKMMLFLDIERCELLQPFQFGNGRISSYGRFAIGYTFEFNNVIEAHGISKL